MLSKGSLLHMSVMEVLVTTAGRYDSLSQIKTDPEVSLSTVAAKKMEYGNGNGR